MAYLGPSLRREKRKERPVWRAGAAVVASVLLNAALLWALAVSGAFRLAPGKDSARVALAPIGNAQWEANRAVAGQKAPDAATPKPPDAQRPKEQEDERKAKGQVVDIAPPKDARRPNDSRFLAEHDSTVERETRSRFAGKKYQNTLPAPQGGAPGTARPVPGGGARDEAGKRRAGESAETRRERERLALAPRPEHPEGGELPRPRAEREAAPRPAPGADAPSGDAAGAGRGRSGDVGIDRRLLPDAESLARIAGGPSPDHLEDVEEGDATALNTQQFKYATFIVRVGKAIFEQWNPNGAYNARDPGRAMYPNRDWKTTVDVVLDPSGALEFVKVQEKSGLDFLDHEVVRAARAAAPFPNPPHGMIGADGKVHVLLQYTLLAAQAEGRFRVIAPSLPLHRVYPER